MLPQEQVAFRRFSVFVGDFDLDAARAVLNEAPPAAISVVGSLIRKSMLTGRDRPAGQRRYQMLETLRQFAADRLNHEQYVTLVRPMAEALPWLLPEAPPEPRR